MSDAIIDAVRSRYGAVAQSGLSSKQGGAQMVAQAFGYTAEELASIPAEANMGLSCGNPTAVAKLREGEWVVDLGSGGGLDVFLASQKVGPSGRAIGIDMTPEMIDLARRNAAKRRETGAPDNVEFHLSMIDNLPIADSTVDCVISNCVINLAPDKRAVFREIARVLKPGGRVAISDIALKRPLPAEIGQNIMAYVGCISGAISIEDYRQGLIEAGFSELMIVDSQADLNAYANVENQSGCCSPALLVEQSESSSKSLTVAAASACCAPSATAEQAVDDLHTNLRELLTRHNVNDYAASVKVFAIKPASQE